MRKSVSSREVIRALKADGWIEVRVTGSHHHFRHPSKPGTTTVPRHTLGKAISAAEEVRSMRSVEPREPSRVHLKRFILSLLIGSVVAPAAAQDAKSPATEDERNCVLAAASKVRIDMRLEPTAGRVRLLRDDELGNRKEWAGFARFVEIDATSVGIAVVYQFLCVLTGEPPVARVSSLGHRSSSPKAN